MPNAPMRDEPLRYVLPVDMGHATPCLIWQRYIAANGYARCRGETGAPAYVHRVVYEQERGPIEEGMHIDHLCRTRACVNPDHLEAVTQAENNRRCSAKLTMRDAEVIRASTLSNRTLAQQYRIDPTVISRVRTGKRWISV